MTKTTILCDICGGSDASTLMIPVKEVIDSPSGRTEDWDEEIDLCPSHMRKLANDLLQILGKHIGLPIMETFREKRYPNMSEIRNILIRQGFKR